MPISKIIRYQIFMLAIQSILYFTAEIFEKNPHQIDRPLDQKIPLIPLFVFVYILWFPLIALFPLHLFQVSPGLYFTYRTTWIIELTVSIAIYLIYPTTFQRPTNLDDYPCGQFLKLIYKYSYKGLNCMPSMHCSMSTMVLFFTLLASGLSLGWKLLYSLVSLGIILSTLFTKQHVILDVITGVFLGIFSSLLAMAIL